ncbi:transposase [Micromonospora sp. NPDC048905]|uniref:transposase n=1 Tax=Micromonospora sp. NPDC048905 TaxID=3155494 RepID=UPI0033C2B21A
MARGDLTNHEWVVLAPPLRTQPVRGDQWRDHRQVINAICWVRRIGSSWRDLPERYGRGFNRRKHWSGLDKLATHFQAALDLVETLDWLRAVPEHQDLRGRTQRARLAVRLLGETGRKPGCPRWNTGRNGWVRRRRSAPIFRWSVVAPLRSSVARHVELRQRC